MNFAHDLLPVIIYFILVSGCLYIVRPTRISRRLKKQHTPLDEIVFRSPGQSLIKKIDDLNQDLVLNGALLVSIPLVSYAGGISHLYFYPGGWDTLYICIFGLTGSVATGIFLINTLKSLKKRQQLRLRYESALAVGQELNRLMLEGYHVYHDVAADHFSIDHLVVGRSGIFAVATGARSNFKPGGDLQAATVEYNGRMLTFPDGDDFKIIEQAEGQASRLSEWIGNATGEPIAARAIVALPGWFVKRTSADGISVVNLEQFSSLFRHIQPRTLSDDLIGRIVHQLEQTCHDAVPASHEYDIQAAIKRGGMSNGQKTRALI